MFPFVPLGLAGSYGYLTPLSRERAARIALLDPVYLDIAERNIAKTAHLEVISS